MIDVKEVFPWWFIIFFDKKTSVSNTSGNIKREIVQNKKKQLKNYINQLLENLENEK